LVTQQTLLDAVGALEGVLSRVREAVSAEGWNEAQRAAHQLIVSAEQGGFSEVANAVMHVEDAVAAVTDGELMPDSATFRQMDAALRSARAACAMSEAQGTPVETPQSRGLVWLVSEKIELQGELLRTIPKKQLEATAVLRAELRARLSSSTPDALIVELGSDEPDDFVDLLADLKQRAPRLALIALSEDGSYRARTAAAQLGAVLYFVLPVSAEKVATALETLDIGTLHERPRVLALALNGSIDWLRNPLEAEGMELKIFHQPELVLEALDASQPSALVLDQGQSPSAGKHVCRLVRAAPRWRDLVMVAIGTLLIVLGAFLITALGGR